VTLAESHQRKAVFLREASRELPNVSVFADRAELLPSGFDWLVSRAVAPTDVLQLKLARHSAILVGGEIGGEKLPWGKDRYLFIRST
jgi:16S rRNA G527 N7-methylase RsmG